MGNKFVLNFMKDDSLYYRMLCALFGKIGPVVLEEIFKNYLLYP